MQTVLLLQLLGSLLSSRLQSMQTPHRCESSMSAKLIQEVDRSLDLLCRCKLCTHLLL